MLAAQEDTIKLGPARRMGPQGSETWLALLDGAEAILREEGHAALTSRRVAEQAGVKQRLVYYYFHTMDDLVIAMFRRLATRELARLEAAAAGPGPLRELWHACIHTTDARLTAEFMALAPRIAGLAAEVSRFIEEARRIQAGALARALAGRGGVDAEALALMATSLALSLTREAQLGIALGHDGLLAAVERFLNQLEPQPAGEQHP
jgi:AcrR family transcriptional regulator